MRLGISDLHVYAGRVITSKALREWLFQEAGDRKQKELAAEWGIEQPTVSRLKTQPDYDIPLNTVAKIAIAHGCRELSEFFRQVETKSVSVKKKDAVTGSVPLKGDKDTSPYIPEAIDPYGAPVHTAAELAEAVAFYREARRQLRAKRPRSTTRSNRKVSGARSVKSKRRKSGTSHR